MKKRPGWIFCTGVVLIMFVSGVLNTPAYGHKVMVFAYEEGGRVKLEGYFADGKKAQDSLVEVFGHDGSRLLEGRTDENGAFSFPMPDDSELTIVLTASMGHRAECTMKARDDAAKKGDQGDASPAVAGESLGMDLDETVLSKSAQNRIRSFVSAELDRRIDPLTREVALLRQDNPSIRDIIGGIGYIVGLMGLFLYFRARREGGTR